MHDVQSLKNYFVALANRQGCIYEHDYHVVCAGLPDEVICELGDWLISSGYCLRRGIGQQYLKELRDRLRHPSVSDVKDTKDRQHKNTDKEQESKRKHLEASRLLNQVIEQLKDPQTEDEFLPAWKKRDAAFKDYVPSMRDMAQALMDYIRNNTSTFKNYQDWLWIIPRVEDPIELQSLWDQAARGDPAIPPEVQKAVNPKKPPSVPKPEYRTEEIVFEDTGEPPLELAEPGKKASQDDPIDQNIHARAKEEYTSKLKKKVKFDNDVVYTVDVAHSPAQKAAGLEVFDTLDEGAGLLFPFEKADHVTFHMGRVRFPIDVLFFMQDELGFKVAKIIHNALPGVDELWSHPETACVLELLGGTCQQDGIEIGSYCVISED